MTEIASILMIIILSAAFVGLLWLVDKAFGEEVQRRKDALREMQREDKRRENTVWEITTRVNDDRSDLFRKYAELEVR